MHCLLHHRQPPPPPHHHHHVIHHHDTHYQVQSHSAPTHRRSPPRARPRPVVTPCALYQYQHHHARCGCNDGPQACNRRPMHTHPWQSSSLRRLASSSSSSSSGHQTTTSQQHQPQQQQQSQSHTDTYCRACDNTALTRRQQQQQQQKRQIQQRRTRYSHPVLSLLRTPSSSSSKSTSTRHSLSTMSSLSSILSPLLLTLLLLLLLLPTTVSAHSFLTYPEPYTRCDNHGRHICPPPLTSFDKANPVCVKGNSTARNPSAVFKRGDKVVVKWARNNHNGGFIRLGFVPVAKMFDAHMHARMAFYYGCWEQGKHRCKGVQCGSDLFGFAFRRTIYIPAALPDGKYVLSFLWFGGTDQPRDNSQFGDYSSCAFIHISGGRRYKPKPITPFFVPGTPREMAKHGENARTKCLSYTDRPGACKKGCGHLKAKYMKPYPFDEVAKTKWMRRGGHGARGVPKWEKVTLYKRPKAIPPRLFENEEMRKRICNHGFGVCCPVKCRVCEGYNCGQRRGGPRNCCPDRIQQTAPLCGDHRKAPCRLR